MSGRRILEASAGKKTRLTRAQAATAAAVMELESSSTTLFDLNSTGTSADTQGAREQTPEVGILPPRRSKVKALGNKVWKAVMPVPKRKRTVLESEQDTGTPTATQVDDDVAAAPQKRVKTRTSTASTPLKPSSSRPQSRVSVPNAGSQGSAQKSAGTRAPVHSRASATTASSGITTVIQDKAVDEVSSGEEDASEDDTPRVDDDQSDSGDDPVLDARGDDLEAHLAVEKPVWQENVTSVHAKGKARTSTSTVLTARARTAVLRTNKRFMYPDDFDNSSGSEFAPSQAEDEDDGEEDEHEEEVGGKGEVGTQRAMAGVASCSSKPAKKVKAPSKAQLARQRLETPTWKQGSAGTSTSGARANVQVASSQAAKSTSSPHPIFPTMPAPTPISVPSATHPLPLDDDDRAIQLTPAAHDSDSDRDHDTDVNSDSADVSPAVIDLITNPPAQSFVLVFPPTGGPLNITPQQPPIQATLHGANATVIKNIVFQNAFPDTFGRSKFAADALLEAATIHGYTGLVERLEGDAPFLRSMSGVAKQRISNFRGTIKKAAEGFVLGFYGIGALSRPECASKVVFMLENLTYIYPFVYQPLPGRRSVPWHQPYSHPCVLALLTTSFFQGPKSIAAKYPDLFPSSLLDRLHEHEIPSSMLALVGVSIHAALAEWKSGVHRSIPFAADSFVDVYNEHMTTLEGIKFKNLGAYHTMLHRLYKSASNITPLTEPATLPVTTALAHVDVDAMEVD